MTASLPYLAAPGTIKNSLEKIRAAATPERVTGDFMATVCQMKGGKGADAESQGKEAVVWKIGGKGGGKAGTKGAQIVETPIHRF